MARLNDPPATAVESLDTLKRRFIRQNREIARVNSTQSQRIRNLENEISRLLAENIALREQAIAAAAEAEKLRLSNRLGNEVIELRDKLGTKLAEVTALVDELGTLPAKVARKSCYRRRKSGFVQDVVGSPNERDWRSRQTMSGLVTAEHEPQEGRLPAILEDKYYPRRTLEKDELRLLTTAANVEGEEDTESPALGPPPVAHFEVSEPIAFDSTKSPKRVSGGMVTNDDETAAFSTNMEARRRRRTSSLLHEIPSLGNEVPETQQEEHLQPASAHNPSIKRKFEASEAESESGHLSRNDGFEYQRREPNTTNRRIPSRFTPRPTDRIPQNEATTIAISPRKALAPKSTNSPTKHLATGPPDKPVISKDDRTPPLHPVARITAAPRAVNVRRIESLELGHADSRISDCQYAPKTPAAALADMVSPSSSAIDTAPKPKSTEAAVISSVEDVLSGTIGRGSRRTKAAVSYAEPNLRDKMRRPDKKLVGAVEGLNKVGTSSDREPGRERSTELALGTVGSGMVTVKSERQSGDVAKGNWKDLPETKTKDEVASPLQDRQKPSVVLSSDSRKKRTHSESEGTRAQRSRITTNAQDELDKAASRLSIFDPPDSSPVSSKTEDKQSFSELERSSTIIRTNPNALNNLSKTTSTPATRARRLSVQPAGNSASVATASHAAEKGLTRSSSAISMRDTSGKENFNNIAAISKLKRTNSVQAINSSSGSGGAIEGRTMGMRRRSTLV